MRLIAKKPCSFGGQKFFIDDEVPEELVADTTTQERLGVLAIVNRDNDGVLDGELGTPSGKMFTQGEVDNMIAEAVEKATAEIQQTQDELQQVVAELQETEHEAYEGTIQIAVKGESSGENGQTMAIPVKPEEIQQVFSILQMNAEEGAKAIADVTNENVLILLHVADSRKTIKNAAKEQADKLFSTEGESNEYSEGKNTGSNTEGADT